MKKFGRSLLLSVSALAAGQIPLQLSAAPCPYDVKPLPLISGTVTRVTGDGIMLDDGTDVVLPESLLPYAKLDMPLRVRGLRAVGGASKVWGLALDVENGAPVCPSAIETHKGAYPGSPIYDVIVGGTRPTPPR